MVRERRCGVNDLFKDANVGDKVAIPYSGGDIKQGTIAKVTPTQIVVDDVRYRRSNGNRIGEGKGYIKPWTAEHTAAVARYKASRRLSDAIEGLRRVATGWGTPIASDTAAANALAEQIETYIAAQAPKV
jgi:hypothetical protein